MNRLASAGSAYLRSAAGQPVHWHPWGEGAFAEARASDRPVLLDIGAVWCHWCHVMDHESYEDPALAGFLNEHFVCIKVDRDERPDVDARYQRAVQLVTGQGGWPLTAVLDPEGGVVFGGTYFPPDDRWGRPGFRTVLEQLAAAWREDQPRLREQAAAIRRAVESSSAPAGPGTVTPAVLLSAERRMLAARDQAYGGFGDQPKFPHPTALRFLLRRWADSGSFELRHTVLDTLHAMGRGGIHDQLGGGFHRYSVDRQWVVPHFEKMASDNAELLRVYVEAAAAFDDAECRSVARGIVSWIRDVLAHEDWGFGASQDADVGPGDDGGYFTWTRDELAEVLSGPTLALALRHFGLGTEGAMPHDPARNVLFHAVSPEALAVETGRDLAEVDAALEEARRTLRRARDARPAPVVDRTRYASWNGMVASALLQAGAVLGDAWARESALRALAALRKQGVPLAHAPDGPGGLLEDQVHVAEAALDAFEVTGDRPWLEWAEALMTHVWNEHRDEEQGGLHDRRRGQGGHGLLTARLTPIEDAPTPSANGVAGTVLARLAAHTGAPGWRERHRALVEAFGGAAPTLGLHGAAWLIAADWSTHPPVHLVVVGADSDAAAVAMHHAALAAWFPRRVARRLRPGAPADGLPEELAAMLTGDAPRGYVCVGARCLAPVASPAEWSARLVEAARR